MSNPQQDQSSASFVAAPPDEQNHQSFRQSMNKSQNNNNKPPSNTGSNNGTEKPLELTAQNLQKAAQQLLIPSPSSPNRTTTQQQQNGVINNSVPAKQPSFNLFGPTNGDEAVVERYVLSEMGAVRELDDALEKTKQILEASLYQCARQSLYHIAQNREDLQRQQREFELEQLRQEFESKRIQQREEDVKKRELNLLRREEIMIKREEQLMSRDRALERIQIFAHEDLRRQRLISISNVELSEIVLEHVRRVELTAMSDAPQQYFLQTVSKYLHGYNENLKALAHSPKLDKEDDAEEENRKKQQEEKEQQQQQQQQQQQPSKIRKLMQQGENEHHDTAEELVVHAFHPIPPSVSNLSQHNNKTASTSTAAFSLANVRAARLQQQSMLFAIVESAPSFYYKIQRDYSLDLCQLHINGNRAMHVVRDVPLLSKPSIEQQPHQRKVFQFNVLSSVSSTRNPYLVPTSSTLGHGYFDVELFDTALLKSLVLVGGDPLSMMTGIISSSPENSPSNRFSPTRNLLQQSEKSREEMMRAFTSPAINFVYFAPREKKTDQQKQKQILDQMMSEEIEGMKATPGSPEQVAKQVERDHRAHFLAHFEDSVVLVIATVSKPQTQQNQQQATKEPDSPSSMTFNMRPQSAPTARRPGAQQQQKSTTTSSQKTITVHSIMAKVALSSFIDDDNEQEKSSSLNFTASVDLFCKNLIVKRSAPKNKWRSNLHLQQRETSPETNRNPKDDREVDKEAQSRIESALVHSGQAESDLKIPVFSSVATFEKELASTNFKNTVLSHDNVSLYLGVMITSPCGAIEFVKIEDVAAVPV